MNLTSNPNYPPLPPSPCPSSSLSRLRENKMAAILFHVLVFSPSHFCIFQGWSRRRGIFKKRKKMYFHGAGAVCSSFLANAGQHCLGKHPKGGLSRSTFVGFLGRPPENICAEFVSNLEVHLLRVQRVIVRLKA